ncbi:MAG: methylthioribulose 1-phosphate dehydratase [Candidatus Eremiobacteraeota bacterium]|nr:methylthioribulose 1-phosphate dehydratase [Candidatus Eremiobacteraeota bacterium]
MTPHLPLISATIVDELASFGRFAYARGWIPARSGNFSRRIDDRHAAITRSGVDKNAITADDVMIVALDGPIPQGVSAEAPLHVARYRADRTVDAVLHLHSVAATVLSRENAARGYIEFNGYEMQKAIRAEVTHERTLRLPVVSNAQDTAKLAAAVEKILASASDVPAYLLASHGLYVWGESMQEAQRHVEGLEFLLQCTLEERRMDR